MSSKNRDYKTNVSRLLDSAKIPYTLHTYEVDEEDLSAIHLAETLGIDPKKIYKTIVLETSDRSFVVAMVAAGSEIDLKKVASVHKVKSVKTLPMKDLLATTGYIRGGCSPIGLKKPFPVYINSDVLLCDTILISAGKRGVQVELLPKDLISYVGATVADISQD
ncbi:MAG: Cys-tRNA(Pro) deacylase [Porphyromonas sp.]|nr:Cys-tRNA(Pro) deacylase [Porphyromonas sp.]